MDIFKFKNPTASTLMQAGEIINGLKSKMWVERYREAGEFKFVGNVSTGIRDILPTGSLISHTNSTDIMVVENHEINDVKGKPTEVIITGRSFESFLENRVVGSNRVWPSSDVPQEYILASALTWNQAVTLIKKHILPTELVNQKDALPNFQVVTYVTGSGETEERLLRRGDVYSRLIEILDVDKLGIRVIRPGAWSPLGAASANTAIEIHRGIDRSADVIFSHNFGDVESAEYLWSIKRLKNCALVSGRWVETLVDNAASNLSRRMMFVDASDIDNIYSAAPTGATRTAVVNAMRVRGQEALAAQKEVALAKADISKEAKKAIYRADFDVGDIITVDGDYNETSKMRVNEYVEIEDETGESGYPTLTAP